MPTCTGAAVIVPSPVLPLIGVGPLAVSVQSVGTPVAAVVPLSTTLMSVSTGETAVLVIVQTTFPLTGTRTRDPFIRPP